MRIAESLPTYGVHYYEVKDKAGIPWWLGISFKGICQYDQTDRKVPRKLFLWKQLENLYFRDRKFSIEVNDPKRQSACRKTFGPGNISVYVWFASSPSLTKCIWSMAIAQHQFYLDRKHNKSALSLSRNFSEIADELSHGSYSTETSSLGRSVSSLSLPALKIDSDSCDETLDMVEIFVALKARREALEEALRKRCDELKRLCLREGDITGSLPPEMPLSPGEQIPVIKKQTGVSLPPEEKFIWKKKSKDEEELLHLELEREIQSKIVSAAFKLANDSSSKKNIRRQRKISHQKAVSKLKEIEQRLSSFKKQVESLRKGHLKIHSEDEHSEDNLSHSTDENEQLIQATGANLSDFTNTLSVTEADREDANNCFNKMTSSSSSPVPLRSIIRAANSNSVPSSPSNMRHTSTTPNQYITTNRQKAIRPDSVLQGYTPSSVYQTKTTYRSQQYPTFSMRSPSSYSTSSGSEFDGISSFNLYDQTSVAPSLSPPYQNRFESTLDIEGSNLYSVPTQRTSQAFDSQDDILASMISPHDLGLMSRHNSLDRNRRHCIQRYLRHIDSTHALTEPQRPSSVQPSPSCDDSITTNQGIGMFPYQEQKQRQLQSHFSTYSSDHPHHFHHRRSEVKSPSNEDSNTFVAVPSLRNENIIGQGMPPGVNMYQTNLKMYAADAMLIGNSQTETRYRQHHHTSPTPTVVQETRHWVDSSVAKGKSRTQSVSPYDSGLSSPSSTIDRHWLSTKSQQSVPMAHSNVDVITYGHYQPYWEETKPYETSDFYKYSTKHRKQHQAASQNLHSKLSTWKANQDNSQYLNAVPKVMSPVLERSRTASPAYSMFKKKMGDPSDQASLNQDEKILSENLRKESSTSTDLKTDDNHEHSTISESFHDGMLDWLTNQENGKKTTLV